MRRIHASEDQDPIPDDNRIESIPEAETVESLPDAPMVGSIPDAETVEDRAGPFTRTVAEEPKAAQSDWAASEPAPQPAPPRRRSGAFLGFVTGGVLAAAGGFGLARYVPEGFPLGDTEALKAQIEQQTAALADLKAQIDVLAAREMPDPSAAVAALRGEIDDRLAALPAPPDPEALAAEARSAAEAAMAELETRLTAMEKRPAGTGGGVSDTALAAYDRDLQQLRAMIEGQGATEAGASEELKALAAATESQLAAVTTEAERLRAEAESAGRAALARADLARINAALDAGGPFTSAVAELTEMGHEVPGVLADAAAVGVPTLPDLQRSFPEAARAALDAGLKAEMGDDWTDRVTAYLRTQTGARSLRPLEGNDPDAVLSRAEAAVAAGRVAEALTELAALPDAAKTAIAGWVAAAEQREAAVAAVAALSTALNAE